MDFAVGSEGGYWLAGLGVEGVEVGSCSGEDACVWSFLPVGDSALAAADGALLVIGGVELPDFLAGFGVYREYFSIGGGGVEDSVDDEAVRLEFAFVAGVEGPGLFEVFDVLFVDLGEGGIVGRGLVAEVGGPVGLGYRGEGQEEEGFSHSLILCDGDFDFFFGWDGFVGGADVPAALHAPPWIKWPLFC